MKNNYKTDPRWEKVRYLCKNGRFEEANKIVRKMNEEYEQELKQDKLDSLAKRYKEEK